MARRSAIVLVATLLALVAMPARAQRMGGGMHGGAGRHGGGGPHGAMPGGGWRGGGPHVGGPHGGGTWHGGGPHGGPWHGGRWHGAWRGGVFVGVVPGWGWGPYWGYPYYGDPDALGAFPAYPDDAYPPVEEDVPQPDEDAASSNGDTWYWCPSAQGYYPDVPECPEAWLRVAPRAPSAYESEDLR